MYEHLARCHQTRARAVQGRQVEPVLALQLDEAHGRSRSRLGDPRRIVIIVLLCTDVGADILRRHQSDLMPLRSEETADVMRSAARLHSNRARWELACKFGKGRPSHASAQDDPSLHIQELGRASCRESVCPYV